MKYYPFFVVVWGLLIASIVLGCSSIPLTCDSIAPSALKVSCISTPELSRSIDPQTGDVILVPAIKCTASVSSPSNLTSTLWLLDRRGEKVAAAALQNNQAMEVPSQVYYVQAFPMLGETICLEKGITITREKFGKGNASNNYLVLPAPGPAQCRLSPDQQEQFLV